MINYIIPEITIMNVNFLSLDPAELPAAKITSELIPMVNTYLLEFYSVKKQMDDPSLDPETRKTATTKFKLIVDLIEIYKDPNILKTIKEYQEEKERDRLRAIEMEKKRQEMLQRERDRARDDSGMFGGMFGDFWNSRTGGTGGFADDSSDDDIKSDVSEDEFHQDKFTDMLDKAHEEIYTRSTLQQNINVDRRYQCGLEESEGQNDADQTVSSNGEPDPESAKDTLPGDKPKDTQ